MNTTTHFGVGDLLSSMSARGVEKQVSRLSGVSAVQVNPVAGGATVTFDPSLTSTAAIRMKIDACGYHCSGESLPQHLSASHPPPAAAPKPGATQPTRAADDHEGHATNLRKIHLFFHAPETRSVFVAAFFNDWKTDGAPLHRHPNGNWDLEVSLAPGRYEDKFVVDGQWSCEPGSEHGNRDDPKFGPNQFGTLNRILEV
jgi:copper chaperone CopZ